MACNFNISVTKASDHVRLKLNGDFDGSSACELLNLLNDCDLSSTSEIQIDTDFLKDIYPFGLDVLHNRMSTAKVRELPLTFSGKMSTRFTVK